MPTKPNKLPENADNSLTATQLKALQKITEIEFTSYPEMATGIGIGERQLYNWLHNPEFLTALVNLFKEHLQRAKPLVVQQLIKRATKGEFKAMRLFFELSGDLLPQPIQQNQQLTVLSLEFTDKPSSNQLPPAQSESIPVRQIER